MMIRHGMIRGWVSGGQGCYRLTRGGTGPSQFRAWVALATGARFPSRIKALSLSPSVVIDRRGDQLPFLDARLPPKNKIRGTDSESLRTRPTRGLPGAAQAHCPPSPNEVFAAKTSPPLCCGEARVRKMPGRFRGQPEGAAAAHFLLLCLPISRCM